MPVYRVGLIGDFDPQVVAHRAIPLALELAASDCAFSISADWMPTEYLRTAPEKVLEAFAGFWCVPGSPYRDMDGALRTIRFARETRCPFLGTCGGFQHAVIEYARSVLGLTNADHMESNPDAELPLITALACRLAATTGRLILQPGTKVAQICGTTEIEEIYNCGFGFNRGCAQLFDNSAIRISGLDQDGEIRVIELFDHPFFVATQYQPERRALEGKRHPLVTAFVSAVGQVAVGQPCAGSSA
jgi:CTP synthase (UTP-ammonia lyase)